MSSIWRLDDAWFADDKLLHGSMAYALALTLPIALAIPPWLGAAISFASGILIEVVELVRYRRWGYRTDRWPWLADLISPKDLVWDAVGALLAWGVLAIQP